MNPQNALEKYGKAVQSIKDHQEKNKQVFDENTRLMLLVIDAENELRDIVAEANAGVSDDKFKVIVTPQTQTFADIEEIDKILALRNIVPSDRDKIVKTIQRPSRISISEIK